MWHGQNKGETKSTKNQNAFYYNNEFILKLGKKSVNDILPFIYHITDGLQNKGELSPPMTNKNFYRKRNLSENMIPNW